MFSKIFTCDDELSSKQLFAVAVALTCFILSIFSLKFILKFNQLEPHIYSLYLSVFIVNFVLIFFAFLFDFYRKYGRYFDYPAVRFLIAILVCSYFSILLNKDFGNYYVSLAVTLLIMLFFCEIARLLFIKEENCFKLFWHNLFFMKQNLDNNREHRIFNKLVAFFSTFFLFVILIHSAA